VITACGPILDNYNFPEEITVRCSKASCKLQCPIGQEPRPKFIKCNPKKKKFSPKAFSKVSCGVTALSETAKIGVDFFPTNSSMTNCGDILKKKSLKFSGNVKFSCQDSGCDLACENGKRPNVARVKCFTKGKRKKLVPNRANVKC